MRDIKADLCVIGAGSAGLSAAAGAVQLGLKVVLFEAREMGGDCLNWGCVPSKSLIAAAKAANDARGAGRLGVDATPSVDWAKVKAHVKGVIAKIEPHDSQERFERLGVTVIREAARFLDHRTVVSETVRVRARRFAIATGSHPVIPDIPGLRDAAFHTNETIFDLEDLPKRLLVLGAGAVGVELGQAFRRLGAEVTIVEAARALGGADREAADIVLAVLRRDGIELLEGWKAISVSTKPGQVALRVSDSQGVERVLEGTHLLVAVGRSPNLHGLDLDKAGVAFDRKGVKTSLKLRTANPRIWALGDCAGRELFTHAAGWHASAFVRNALFKAATPVDSLAIPSVVYAEPELAQIGLTEADAAESLGAASINVARSSFAENDRALCEDDTQGFVKIVIGKGGRILGATIVGAHAGDLIAPIALAMAEKLTIRSLTKPVLPYPTRSEAWKRAAGAYFTPLLFSERTRALVRVLQSIP
jgi:pyruvate/2-oxoglutarate dehydrogenase complex dihydrolipoamide dehydrogenase (E3) component